MNEIVLTEHKSNYINTYYIFVFVCLVVPLFACIRIAHAKLNNLSGTLVLAP